MVDQYHVGVTHAIEPAVCVFGLGYVGLPLVRSCVDAGWDVIGFDPSKSVVDGLLAGRSHIDDVSDREVAGWLRRGFTPSNQVDELATASFYVICVPTPLTPAGGPDLTAVREAGTTIAALLKAGDTVVLESTTYPGTTEDVLGPILETSGLRAGVDFALAFSPERIDPGNPQFSLENTPKVVGGLTLNCRENAAQFYESLGIEVVATRGLREAEMAKLLENTYRHVNIALVNELARFCHALDIDIWDVIKAAATKPYGFQPFWPGPGVGGHCIPIDPNYLSHHVRQELGQPFRFVELAQEINQGMPAYVVSRTQGLLNKAGQPVQGNEILILGVTYKADIADTRETPATAVVRGLRGLGGNVSFHDPYVNEWHVDGIQVPRAGDWLAAANTAAYTVLLQSHREYRENLHLLTTKRLFDTRGLPGVASSERL